MHYKSKGFSVVELLVTLAIIAVILGLIIPRFVDFQKGARVNAALEQASVINKAVQSWASSLSSVGAIGSKFLGAFDMPGAVFNEEVSSHLNQAENLSIATTTGAGGVAYSTSLIRQIPNLAAGQSFGEHVVTIKGRTYVVSPADATKPHLRILHINRDLVVVPFLTAASGAGAIAGKSDLGQGIAIIGSQLDSGGSIGNTPIATDLATNAFTMSSGASHTFKLLGGGNGITADAPNGFTVSIDPTSGIVTVTAAPGTPAGNYIINLRGPNGANSTINVTVDSNGNANVTPIAQTISASPASASISTGGSAIFVISGGNVANAIIASSGYSKLTASVVDSTITISNNDTTGVVAGTYSISVYRAAGNNYLQSNTLSIPITITTSGKQSQTISATSTSLTLNQGASGSIVFSGGKSASNAFGNYQVSGPGASAFSNLSFVGNELRINASSTAPGVYNLQVSSLGDSMYEPSNTISISITVKAVYKVTYINIAEGINIEVECPEGMYILQALEAAHLDVPYGTRAGSDDVAIGRILNGSVQDHGSTYLTDYQRSLGYFSYDISSPTSDVIFEYIGPDIVDIVE